jgi:hypothetical protein
MIQDDEPKHIKDILTPRKYLGVPINTQLDATDGKEKILRKLGQRIGLIAAKANSIQEARISHNMMVCQVATFSPICIHMSLKECADIDKQIIKTYQYRLKYMHSDAKHGIFLSKKGVV